jgi:16S rRNA (guanine527-N7)-methyltransferase
MRDELVHEFHVKQQAGSVSRETRMVMHLTKALAPFALSDKTLLLLARHWLLITQWNQRINLTAIHDDKQAAWNHYRDSLEALRFLPAGQVVDLGSGAGFPGMALAIAKPDLRFTLVDRRRKRTSFLEVAKARLELANVQVETMRMEDEPPMKYAAVITRATFSHASDLQACLRWLAPDGRLIAFRSSASLETLLASSGFGLHRYEIGDRSCFLALYSQASAAK